MKKFTLAIFALSLAFPLAAQAEGSKRMTAEQLIQYATDKKSCEDRSVVSARYVNDIDNNVEVTCGDAEGFVPLAGGLGGLGGGAAAAAAGGLALAVVAAGGGGGSTSDTQ